MLSLNATKYNLIPFNRIMGDFTKDNLYIIATPISIIALSVTPLVFFALVKSNKILNNSTYYSSICFKRLFKYIKPFLNF